MAKNWKAPKHLTKPLAVIGLDVKRAEEVINCHDVDCNFVVNVPRAAQCCADTAKVQALLALDKAGLLA